MSPSGESHERNEGSDVRSEGRPRRTERRRTSERNDNRTGAGRGRWFFLRWVELAKKPPAAAAGNRAPVPCDGRAERVRSTAERGTESPERRRERPRAATANDAPIYCNQHQQGIKMTAEGNSQRFLWQICNSIYQIFFDFFFVLAYLLHNGFCYVCVHTCIF